MECWFGGFIMTEGHSSPGWLGTHCLVKTDLKLLAIYLSCLSAETTDMKQYTWQGAVKIHSTSYLANSYVIISCFHVTPQVWEVSLRKLVEWYTKRYIIKSTLWASNSNLKLKKVKGVGRCVSIAQPWLNMHKAFSGFEHQYYCSRAETKWHCVCPPSIRARV